MTAIITRDELRTLTPSVFATTPWEGMSHSYSFIPTAEVLDMMADQGFRVTSARQSRTRIQGKATFTRHMLRLRHDSFLATAARCPRWCWSTATTAPPPTASSAACSAWSARTG